MTLSYKLLHILMIISKVFLYSIIGLGILLTVTFLFGIRPYVVLSGSMESAIHTGSVCFVAKEDFYNVKENDIIAFQRNNTMITHRAVKIENSRIYTKGDANKSQDNGYVTPSDFKGITVFSVPYAGYLLYSLPLPLTIGVILFFIIGVTATDFVLTKYRSQTENKKGEHYAEKNS